MRLRTDGLTECAFSELDAAQKREAVAMLPAERTSLATCPFCMGVLKPKVIGGRQTCSQCKVASYPPPWRETAALLYWRVRQDGTVHGYDREIRF